jgi:hypothetical protein
MPRVYRRALTEKPDVDVLDWELIERLHELFSNYTGEDGRLRFYAEDSRGEYEEGSLDEFRAAVARQDQTPRVVTITLNRTSSDAELHFHIWWGEDRYERGGTFTSTNEADVVYVAQRSQEILQQAHERRKERAEAEESRRRELERMGTSRSEARQTTRPAGTSPPTRATGFFYNPWVVTVGGSLAVAAIIALVVSLTH